MTKAIITSVEQTETVGLFSITYVEENESEFAKFLIRFKDDARTSKDIQKLVTTIDNIKHRGALERYFRPEGRMTDNVVALPTFKSSIRLYCLRLSDEILIIGSGGMKGPGKYQDYPELLGCVISLQKLDLLIKEKIREGTIVLDRTDIIDYEDTTFDI